MIDTLEHLTAKQAIEAGFTLFHEFFDEVAAQPILLEGLELDEDNKIWKITISFHVERGALPNTGLAAIIGTQSLLPQKRTFQLDASSGKMVRLTA